MAKPIIITSVLPFGISKDEKGNILARFSLCVDLKYDYPDGEKPDFPPLQAFLLSYATKKEHSAVDLIKNNLKVEFDGGGDPLSGELCFESEFINNAWQYWDILCGNSRERSQPTSWMPSFTPNPLKGKTTDRFQKADDPSAVFKKLISSVESLKKAEQKRIQNSENDDAGNDIKKTLEGLQEEANKLESEIKRVERNLAGIAAFSSTTNDIQTTALRSFQEKFDLESVSIKSSQDAIFDTFSFISSNIILQRLFATTVDFQIAVDKLPDKPVFTIGIPRGENFGVTYVDWEHRATSMEYRKVILENWQTGISVIVAKKVPGDQIELPEKKYYAANYDFGAKLKSISDLYKKIESIKQKAGAAKTESDRYKIWKEIIAIDSAALTRGMNIFDFDIDTALNKILSQVTSQVTIAAPAAPAVLLDKDVTRGFRYGVKTEESQDQITSLGQRSVTAVDKNGKNLVDEKGKDLVRDDFKTQEFAVCSDVGMHALVEESGTVQDKLLVDSAIMTWSGENIGMPSVFSNEEDETNFQANETDGSLPASTDLVSRKFSEFFKEEFFPKAVTYAGEMKRIGKALDPGKEPSWKVEVNDAPKPITLQYRAKQNAKLLLGRSYQVCLVPEYKNGWGPRFNPVDVSGNNSFIELGYEQIYGQKYTDFKFKRNEPVKPISFFLEHPLTQTVKETVGDQTRTITRPANDRDGESLHHLVIRNYDRDDDVVQRTTQTSVRYILPPAISFEQAFWHGKIFEIHKEYGRTVSHNWYLKHHFPINMGDPKPNTNGEFYNKWEARNGSTMMWESFGDSLDSSEIINYLPDPLSKGFWLEFYWDKNYSIKATEYEKYEQKEYYFSGKYPKIRAWKIVIKDIGEELVHEDYETINIRLEKGRELFVRARTILHENYEDQFETFGNYNDFTKFGNNDLLTPPLEFSIVHATQRPLVRPKLNNTIDCKKTLGGSEVSLTTTINLEQLGTYKDQGGILRYIEDTKPTGLVELYAKWEEYSDDPNHLATKDWTPDKPVNKLNLKKIESSEGESSAVFEASFPLSTDQIENMEKSLNRISDSANDLTNYAVDLSVQYDSKETKYIEKWIWIKNKSRFSSYYPASWGVRESNHHSHPDDIKSREIFNKISSKPFLVKLLNSKKPNRPILAERNIIPVSVIEDSKKSKTVSRTSHLRRLRFYFERGRLSSGKGERIAFVVNESKSPYNDYLIANNLVSAVGRDIVSGSLKPYDGLYRNDGVLLTKANFTVRDPYDLRDYENGGKAKDIEAFDPQYVEDLGIMTFVPKIDVDLNLWYIDVELDIEGAKGEKIHTPFLQFAMVHYQENSFNYNDDLPRKPGERDILMDCRISEIQKSGFVYLMADRTVTVETKSSSNLMLKVSADRNSLINVKHDQRPDNLRTEFFALVEQRSPGGIKWTPTRKNDAEDVLALAIPNKTTEIKFERRSGNHFRLVLLETETRNKPSDYLPKTFNDIHEDKDYRIVRVDTFPIEF